MQILEHFYTIQGEGRNCGYPAYFIRSSGCHMRCSWCDSKFTWKASKSKDVINLSTAEDATEFCASNVIDNSLVVITGGEPLVLKNKVPLLAMVNYCVDNIQSVNIETTMLASGRLIFRSTALKEIEFWNGVFEEPTSSCDMGDEEWIGLNSSITYSISPKLDVDSYRVKDVTKKDIFKFYSLKWLDRGIAPKNKFYYKFVYEEKTEALLRNFIKREVPERFRYKIYVMPCTPSPFNDDENEKNKLAAVEFCKNYNVNYSPRLHIDLWGLKRGV